MDTPLPESTVAAPGALSCPWCGGSVDVKSRHVAVSGSAVRIYCSDTCLQAWTSGAEAEPSGSVDAVAPPLGLGATLWPRVLGISIGLGALVLLRGAPFPAPETALGARAGLATMGAAIAPTLPLAPVLSPEAAARQAAAVAEQLAAKQAEAALVADLAKDAWFHPLAGPKRRMPQNHTQAFGAERPGERPPDCLSGHCGVDLGGGLWGEPVHAAHDGVVDRVNRGPNEDHGGVYVRIAHRERSVFTWYFHLAAVPRWITPGTRVSAGQVIGLIGDTGIKRSAPHLHFAISVKPSADAPERYLDPESLVAIWPLWLPDEDGSGIGRVVMHEPPGVPVRVRNRRKPRPARPAATETVANSNAPPPGSTTTATAPTPATPVDAVPAASP